jgi:hypothetical protein
MKINRALWLILLLVMALILAACGGDDDDDDSGGSGSASSVTLSESITSESPDIGSLTINYPEGYAASNEEAGQIIVASSAEVLELATADTDGGPLVVQEGQFALIVTAFPDEFAGFFGVEDGAGIGVALNAMVTGMFAGDEDTTVEFGEVEEADFGGNSGAIVTGTITEDGTTNDGIFVLLDVEGGYGLVFGIAGEDQAGNYDAVTRAVAGSLQYTAPVVEEGAEG